MLKQQIQLDVTGALKQGNSESAGVLRLILSSINSREKEKRYNISKRHKDLSEEKLIKESALTDEEVISVLSSEVKKRKDAIDLYQKGNRQELADKEKKEIEIIQTYLPEQLSEDEVRTLVKESIDNVGAKEMKDMGKVMADFNAKVKGRADGGEVSKIVKELLAK